MQTRMNKKGSVLGSVVSGLLGGGSMMPMMIIFGIVAMIALIAIVGLAWFMQENLLQLIGGGIIGMTIMFGLAPAMQADNKEGAFSFIFMFVLLGGALIATPYIFDGASFSVADLTEGEWIETNIDCDVVQDCIKGLNLKGVSLEIIEENSNLIKCEEACFYRE